MTRQRGISVEMLDFDRLETACFEHGLLPLSYGTNALLRRDTDGAAVVISHEGVGSTKLAPGRVYLDTQSSLWQSLPLEAVEACRTGETRDLADVIRTFGSRLDVNHYLWVEWTQKTGEEED